MTFGGSLLPQRLEEAGHTVFAMADTDRDMRRLLAVPEISSFWARPEAIPIDPCQFDVVFSHQSFHLFRPRPDLVRDRAGAAVPAAASPPPTSSATTRCRGCAA